MFSMGAFAIADIKDAPYQLKAVKHVNKTSSKTLQKKAIKQLNGKMSLQEAHFKQNYHEGTERYIVRLVDKPVTTYRGGVKGYAATNLSSKSKKFNSIKFNAKSTESKQYLSYLDSKQASFISKASSALSAQVPNLRSLKYAINGLITELTFEQAKTIAAMDEVAFVERDYKVEYQTDTGPELIGAGEVWGGTATGTEFLGEGVVIGVIDSGINTDHRSFAATGDDGYTVVNPLGDGNFIGDCVTDATLCNSKLIGVRSYAQVIDNYLDPIFAGITRPANGEDYDGHGSHTASTAAGNVLFNVPLTQNDPTAGVTDDGIERDLIFARMSGVAPHANIIAYHVLFAGNNTDTFSGGFGSTIVTAIDDAIGDDVDVINYSIGSTRSQFSPWSNATEKGFLSARAVGIFVAVAAGNSGPDPETSNKGSPWYTSVAATTHGRIINSAINLDGFTGGDTAVPAAIVGGGVNGGFTGDMVWAGDFTNSNDPAGDPAQCLQPFPAATFLATQIVVCDRGAIARVDKATNAAAGGAGGFVLTNLQGGAANIANDSYEIPGVQINADDGDALKLWLASGTGHRGSISLVTYSTSVGDADTIASFSSRGPNELVGVIAPSIAAPGVSIYAAFADDQPFMDVSVPTPSDFNAISGTSMASPHIAGSAALLTEAHPTWDPDQIRSALMMTATTALLKEDVATAADPFDMGAGRVQVNLAVNAGLVMSETEANYLAADPSLGGTTSTLNIPSLADYACSSCSWTRTFTAITTDTYTLSSADALLTVSPASIDATAGEDYVVNFSYDASGLATFDEVFAQVDIAPTIETSPALHLPVYVKVNNGKVPTAIDVKAGRNTGSYKVLGFVAPPSDNIDITFVGLLDANATGKTTVVAFDDIAEDSDTSSASDDITDGVFVKEFNVGGGIKEINIAITEATSSDFDLWIQKNVGGDAWSAVGQAATSATNESITISGPGEGLYRALVQNFVSSTPGGTDSGVLTIDVVPVTEPIAGMTIEAQTSTNGLSELDVRLFWDLEHIFPFGVGSKFAGTIFYSNGAAFEGEIPVTIERIVDDVTISSSTVEPVTRGEVIDYTITVNTNQYTEDMKYGVDVDLPLGTSIVAGSVVASGGDVTVKDPNAVGLSETDPFSMAEDSNNGSPFDDETDGVHIFEYEVPTATLSMTVNITDSTSGDNDLFIQRLVAGNWVTIDTAATAGADESSTIASPLEGSYRAVVQNWASGSGLAEDTGNLHVNLTPASGEGLIWAATSIAATPGFNVVSSVDEPMCAVAAYGGYTPLEDLGIGTIGLTGDGVTATVLAGRNFNLYGVDHDGLTITDDGFAIASGTVGSNPWNNLPIPNAGEPNDLMAVLWKDLEIFDSETRGIRVATAGAGLSVVEWDEIGAFGDDTESYSFQLWAIHGGTDAPGDYEYVMSYATTQVGDITNATAGLENGDGSLGVDASAMIQPGIQLCYDVVPVGNEFTISFSLQTSTETVGNPVAPVVNVSSDLIASDDFRAQSDGVNLVNTAPIADAGPNQTVDRDTSGVQVSLSGINTVNLDLDVLDISWIRVGGDSSAVVTSPNSLEAGLDVQNVPNGVYTFKLTVSDGEFTSSDSVTITVTGANSGSQGSGSMGSLLLILLGISFLRRKVFLK